MRNDSFIQVARFPLLGLFVAYTLTLLIYFGVTEQLDFSSLGGVLAIFLVPIICGIFLSWSEAEEKLGLFESLKIQTLFSIIETIIFFVTATIFDYIIDWNTILTIFSVFIIFNYFISGFVRYVHGKEERKTITNNMNKKSKLTHNINNKENSYKNSNFSAGEYLTNMGMLNIISFSFLVLFLGLVFDSLEESILFLFFLTLFLLAMEFLNNFRNNTGVVIMLIITVIISIYFSSIFSIVVIGASGFLLITLITHRDARKNSSQAITHFLNWIYFIVNVLSTFAILFLMFTLIDIQYNISQLLSPISRTILFSIGFGISFIVGYLLILSSSRRTLKSEEKSKYEEKIEKNKENNYKYLTWPISMYIKSSNNLLKDSFIFGSLMSIMLLGIFYLIIIIIIVISRMI